MDLDVAYYKVEAFYEGDNYTHSESESGFRVGNKYLDLCYHNLRFNDNDDINLSIYMDNSLGDYIEGTVNLTILDSDDNVIYSNDSLSIKYDYNDDEINYFTLPIGHLDAGKYNIVVKYDGSEGDYEDSIFEDTLTVLKASEIIISAEDIPKGEDAVIGFTLIGSDGSLINDSILVSIFDNEKTYYDEKSVKLEDGQATIILEKFNGDFLIIFASYAADGYYDEELDDYVDNPYDYSSAYGALKTFKVYESPIISLNYKDGNLIVNLSDAKSNPIPDASLTVLVDGIESNVTTGDDGVATLPVSANATVDVVYVDEEGIETVASLVIVENNNTVEKIVNNTIEKIVNNTVEKNVYVYVTHNGNIALSTEDGSSVVVALTDNDGKAIANASVSISVNGQQSNLTTDSEGKVSVNITGNSTIVASYVDENNLTVLSSMNIIIINSINEVNNTIVVNNTVEVPIKRVASQIEYSDMNTVSVNTASDGRVGEYFVITLKDSQGKILVNKDVQIGFNGKTYNRTTDENGSAKLQINLAKEDTYTFAVAFLGDDNYNGSFVVAKIVVTKQTPKLSASSKTFKASAKTKTVTATFKTALGNPIKGKQITFTVNGKTYTGTTNAKGIASVKVSLSKKGTYSFTAKYAGDNGFKAVTSKAKITIK